MVKSLFLISFHAGNYRYKAKVTLPFLEQFQREMKTCTELLLLDPCFAAVKTLVQHKSNPLGSAIALISQLNESKIMAAKTVFTERSLRVATDLFDGHLRETGVLDLEACSKFVEEKTGFKVAFATKMGTDVWDLPKQARGAGALPSGASASLRPTAHSFLLPTPSQASATSSSSNTSSLLSSASSTDSIPALPTPSCATTFSDGASSTSTSSITSSTSPTVVSETVVTSTTTLSTTVPPNLETTSPLSSSTVCPRYNQYCPARPVVPPSKYCRSCTSTCLRDKYNMAWCFGQRSRPSLPRECTREEVTADIVLCGDDHELRAALQKLRDAKWPCARPRKQFEPAVAVASSDSTPPVAAFKPRARSAAPALASPSVVPAPALVPVLSPPTPVPALVPTLSPPTSTLTTPLLPYDVAQCDRACPFCDKTFSTGKPDVARKALAKHVNEHSPDATNSRFKTWLEAANRAWCAVCQLSYSRRLAHHCSGPRAGVPTVVAPVEESDSNTTEVKVDEEFVSPTCSLPSLMDIFSTSVPTVKRIPQKCRVTVAKAYTTVMRLSSTSGTAEQEMRAWKLQFMFAKCVLRQQPQIRGGKKKKVKRNETLCAALLDRLKRWNEGKIDELWAEARTLYPGGERPSKPSSLASNIRRATECAQDARYGKAVAALLSLGTCPMNEETLKEMRAKHPEAALPKLPSGDVPDAVRFDVDMVRQKVEGFPTGSAAGASGTRPQFFKDILACSNKAVGDAALSALTRLTNHMVAGLAPRELAPFIAGAPLMALVKQGGGLRPIAIGETIRRLVSKCCCEATSEEAKVFFGPLQVGVSTQGGAEAAVHAARRLAKEFGNDPGKIMLKVDFSNAFNMVDRTEMIAQVFEKFPGLYRWVEYCYSNPAHLFFGTSHVCRVWLSVRSVNSLRFVGRSLKVKRNALCAALLDRLKRWNEGKIDELARCTLEVRDRASLLRSQATFAGLRSVLKDAGTARPWLLCYRLGRAP